MFHPAQKPPAPPSLPVVLPTLGGTANSHPPTLTAFGLGSPVLVLPGQYEEAFAQVNKQNQLVNGEGIRVRVHDMHPFRTAFSSEFGYDAHCTCYAVRNRSTNAIESPIPRMAKVALGYLKSPHAPKDLQMDVFGHLLALDLDLPGHGSRPWSDEDRSLLTAHFEFVKSINPLLAAPTTFYTTTGGYRLVWALSSQIPIEGARGLGDLLKGLIGTATLAGMVVDTACKEWGRLFRLPRVMREGKDHVIRQMTEQEYFRQSWGRIDFNARESAPESVLLYDPQCFRGISQFSPAEFEKTDLSKRVASRLRGSIGVVRQGANFEISEVPIGPMPNPLKIQQLLFADGKKAYSLAYTRMKMRLAAIASPRATKAQRSEASIWLQAEAAYAYGVLFQTTPLYDGADSGAEGLHTGLLRLAYVLCTCVRDHLGTSDGQVSPQELHALAYAAAKKVNDARGAEGDTDEAVHAEVWGCVSYAYQHAIWRRAGIEQEKSDYEDAKTLRAENDLANETILHGIVQQQLLGWVKHDGPLGAEASSAVREWINAHWQELLIISAEKVGRSVLQFTPAGRMVYSKPSADAATLFSAVRSSRHNLVQAFEVDDKGDLTTKRATEIGLVHKYGTLALDVEHSRLIQHNELKLIDEGGELRPILRLALPGMNNNFTPKYDPIVQEWLHYLGGNLPEKLLDWLACYPKITKSTAALYIQGDQGIGKGLLGQALAYMTQRGRYARLQCILEQFQDPMLKSPLVWGDEDATTSARSFKSVMNVYKQVVSGDFRDINPKGQTNVQIEGHWRVLITSNSDNFIKMDEDLNEAHLGAVIVRTLHIRSDSTKCRNFLHQIGAKEDVAVDEDGVEGYVESGGGTYRWVEEAIPRHIMWLVKNRTVKEGDRLLVEGVRTDYHDKLSMATNASMTVLSGLANVLRDSSEKVDAVYVKDNEIYVGPGGLFKAITTHILYDRTSKLTKNAVVKVIQKLATSDKKVSVRVGKAGQLQTSPRNMWRLDKRELWACLNRNEDDVREAVGDTIWRLIAPADDVARADLDALSNPHVPSGLQLARQAPPTLPSTYNNHHPYTGSLIGALAPTTAKG